MEIIRLSIEGTSPAVPRVLETPRGKVWAITHGEEGRGRWEWRAYLGAKSFPVTPPSPPPPLIPKSPAQWKIHCPTHGDQYGTSRIAFPQGAVVSPEGKVFCESCMKEALEKAAPPLLDSVALHPIGRKDPMGNPLYVVIPEKEAKEGDLRDGQLVLWSLSPGYRGGATFSIEGAAQIIGKGQEAQGAAGRMGGASCPIVHVTGPCELKWTRGGRLYGDTPYWTARFDGTSWEVGPSADMESIDTIFSL